MEGIYFILVLVLALVGAFRGFRVGLIGQIASVLGVGFGLACAHVFELPVQEWLRDVFPSWQHRVSGEFSYSLAASSLLFLLTFVVFRTIGTVLTAALSLMRVGTLNSLGGSLFTVIEYLLFLSIAFNAFIAMSPRSSLMKTATADDGNIVRETMFIAPALLGCEDFEDLAHKVQLEDAKSIS